LLVEEFLTFQESRPGFVIDSGSEVSVLLCTTRVQANTVRALILLKVTIVFSLTLYKKHSLMYSLCELLGKKSEDNYIVKAP